MRDVCASIHEILCANDAGCTPRKYPAIWAIPAEPAGSGNGKDNV